MIRRVVLHQHFAIVHHQQAHQVLTVEELADGHIHLIRGEADAIQINRRRGQWAGFSATSDHPCGKQHIKMRKSDSPLRLAHKQRAGFGTAT